MSTNPQDSEQIERFRDYLMVLARGQLPPSVQGRLEASDVVQDTLLDAYRKWHQYKGDSPKELGGWLRSLLACNLVDAVRFQHRSKRDARREQSIRQELDDSAVGLQQLLATDDSTPSIKLAREEKLAHLGSALIQLPDAQRDVILLRYRDSKSLVEIAEQMNKTRVAVAGLLKRGLANLREALVTSN